MRKWIKIMVLVPLLGATAAAVFSPTPGCSCVDAVIRKDGTVVWQGNSYSGTEIFPDGRMSFEDGKIFRPNLIQRIYYRKLFSQPKVAAHCALLPSEDQELLPCQRTGGITTGASGE